MDCSSPSFFDFTSTCCFDHQNPSIVKMFITFGFTHRGSFNPSPDSQTGILPVQAELELYFAIAQKPLNAMWLQQKIQWEHFFPWYIIFSVWYSHLCAVVLKRNEKQRDMHLFYYSPLPTIPPCKAWSSLSSSSRKNFLSTSSPFSLKCWASTSSFQLQIKPLCAELFLKPRQSVHLLREWR